MSRSPVKNRGKINEVFEENSSGYPGLRLTAGEALKKFITHEVYVQLERCGAAPLEAPAFIDEPLNEQCTEPATVETVSPAKAFPQPVDQPRSASTPQDSPKTNGGPPPPAPDVNWCCSVMWDNKALEELIHHERADHKLYTQMGLGKLLVDQILGEGQSWPVIERFTWLEPFILLDVISNQFEVVGGIASLLVKEKATAETRSPTSTWSLLIPAECLSIGVEIARRFPAVPTTVVLWNAVKTVYEEPQTNGVCGEILLPPRSNAGLTVLVFHHEILDKLRGRQMHLELPESELSHLQLNPYLRYGMHVDIVDKIPTHLTLHACYDGGPREPGDIQIDGYLMPVDGSDVESLDEVDIGPSPSQSLEMFEETSQQ